MNYGRISSSVALIFIVFLSAYFGAVAAASKPSPIGVPLVLYSLGPGGLTVASTTDAFGAGSEIWVAAQNGTSPPYVLTITSSSGSTVWSLNNNSIPVNGLIPVGLSPTLFASGSSFSVALRFMVPYSPGFVSPQTSYATFTVSPSFDIIGLSSSSVVNNSIQAHTVLRDNSGNPGIGVRLGLFLVEGNSSIQISTEKTDGSGAATLSAGESLASGNYTLQLRVLDSSAIIATPIQLPSLSVRSVATLLRTWNSTTGKPAASLLRTDNNSAVHWKIAAVATTAF